jgi:ABC-type sugar transport system ATPase subunit
VPDLQASPLLEMRNVSKTFPGVKALQDVNLKLASGEVLALLGENGAGKSTLMKVLGGAHKPNSGEILIDGKATEIYSPSASQAAGIAIIYQEFNLVPGLSAADNIFLGQEKTRAGFLRRGDEYRQARKLFRRLEIDIDPDELCENLTVAQQQIVEIAKALSLNAKILVMDEPSAALTNREVERLHSIVRELKGQGIGVVYISHRLDEIFTLCDRITVLRDGRYVGEKPVGEVTRHSLIEMMVGRELKNEFPSRESAVGKKRLEVKGLARGKFVRDVSFDVRAGEILGLTGLVGAGRTETVRLIFGADRRDAGTIRLDGKELKIRGPRDAIAARIGLLTEDRKLQGLVLSHTVRENFALPNLDWLSRFGFVNAREERDAFGNYVVSLKIKVPHQEQVAKNLSGGNQQKVVLAKWLARNCEVLIFDEPTRGIDVGAKYEIYCLMNDLVAKGKSIIMISSELPEILGMSDRVLVMHGGQITGEIMDVKSATQEQIMELAVK